MKPATEQVCKRCGVHPVLPALAKYGLCLSCGIRSPDDIHAYFMERDELDDERRDRAIERRFGGGT